MHNKYRLHIIIVQLHLFYIYTFRLKSYNLHKGGDINDSKRERTISSKL